MIVQQDLVSLISAASCAGLIVDINDLQLLTWDAGNAYHIPLALPVGFNAVYIFKYGEDYFKVGKACGQNANPRYQSQHYYTKGASTLAKTLTNDMFYANLIGIESPRSWIINNTIRYNILIPNTYGSYFVNFTEAFFLLKCKPLFEGYS